MKENALRTERCPRGVLAALLALGVALCPNAVEAAGLLIADGGFGGVLELREHKVSVTINHGIAVTHVDQVFFNTEPRQVEALYTFPVPNGASVANFSMWINGSEMVGEVVEKERAREIYNSYKRQRKDPGLLEQVDYKTFEMRIFPIGPEAEQRVQISYYQELNHDDDWATYVYPLASTSRPSVDERVRGTFGIRFEVVSPVPLTAIESPSHGDDFVFAKHTEHYAEASLETTEGSLARDVVLAYRTSRPLTGVDLLTSRRDGEDGFFCMTITAGEELAASNTGMDYVFVLDVSGSMEADRKLETSRNSVVAFVESLGDEDRFEILTFNSVPEPLFGELVAADATHLGRASDFLGSRRAKGGTILASAMGTAYKYASNADRTLNVVILSDGLTDERERTELVGLIRSRPAHVRVFCIGVGNDVNRPLLEQIAGEAGGLAALVSRGDNFERQAQAFRRKLMHPVATNLRVDFPGAEVYDVVPAQLPNLYHGTPVRLYGRYRRPGTINAAVAADLSGNGWDQTVPLEFPDTDTRNPEIERMWAWHRIDSLERAADGGRSMSGEIVRLGEAFSIVTEYTSFIVLENNAEYERWKIERRNALRIAQDRKAQAALRAELDRLRTTALDAIGPAQGREEQQVAQTAPGAPQTNFNAGPSNAPQHRADGRSVDFRLPSPGGGGAIDPVSGGIVLALAGLAAAARRRKRS